MTFHARITVLWAIMGIIGLSCYWFTQRSLHPLIIKNTRVMVEIAATPESVERGLMHRTTLPEQQGMLFVFTEEQPLAFWMRNTHIPLSIAYITAQGKIIDILDMQPHDLTTHESSAPAQYALEVNQGWFAHHGITVGDYVQNIPKIPYYHQSR